jgi:hypothetical protein
MFHLGFGASSFRYDEGNMPLNSLVADAFGCGNIMRHINDCRSGSICLIAFFYLFCYVYWEGKVLLYMYPTSM